MLPFLSTTPRDAASILEMEMLIALDVDESPITADYTRVDIIFDGIMTIS